MENRWGACSPTIFHIPVSYTHLDVYKRQGLFYEDCSDEIIQDDNLARLTTFPNVLITSHMGFFTVEAMQAIAHETLENAYALENGRPLKNKAE